MEEELVQKEEDLRHYDCNPQTPVDKVFNQVTLFQDLCAIMNNDKMDKQLLDCISDFLSYESIRGLIKKMEC